MRLRGQPRRQLRAALAKPLDATAFVASLKNRLQGALAKLAGPRHGEHLPSGDNSKSGWVICTHCGIPLKRPDGGPVALPNGGPLGPDLRQKES